MREGLGLVQGPVGGVVVAVLHGDVPDDGHAAVGVGLDAEGHDGGQDEEHREDGDDLKRAEETKRQEIRYLELGSF